MLRSNDHDAVNASYSVCALFFCSALTLSPCNMETRSIFAVQAAAREATYASADTCC